MTRICVGLLLAALGAGCDGEQRLRGAAKRGAEHGDPVAVDRAARAGEADPFTVTVERCRDARPAVPDPAGLAFFGTVLATLELELSEAPVPAAPGLENRAAPPAARVVAVKLDRYLREGEVRRALTVAELDRVVFRGTRLTLRSLGGEVEHAEPGCELTVRDVLDAVEQTEGRTRNDSRWLGGVDVHHVFFEGIEPAADGAWEIRWGS